MDDDTYTLRSRGVDVDAQILYCLSGFQLLIDIRFLELSKPPPQIGDHGFGRISLKEFIPFEGGREVGQGLREGNRERPST